MSDNLDDVRRIAQESGNSFHARVLTFLQQQGWTVQISPYYSDNLSGKPREIDLLAEKIFPAAKNGFGEVTSHLSVKLFIECKYIKQPTVFWFHNQDVRATLNLLEMTSPLGRTNTYMREHHYLRSPGERTAKLFSGPNVGATEGEQIFKALSQNLNALIALRNASPIVPDAEMRDIELTVSYPVIACSAFDCFYRVEIENDKDDPAPLTEEFLLEVNYAYPNTAGNNISEFFLIDICPFDRLSNLLGAIEGDVAAISVMLSD